jgi:hypothetical protein
MNEIVTNAMTDDEFQEALKRIRDLAGAIRKNALELGVLMSRMSRPQITQVKEVLRGIIGRDHLDRIMLYGKGVIAEYFAVNPKSLPASVFRKLPEQTLKRLNNPTQPIEVLTQSGVKAKTPATMTAIELARAIDVSTGKIRPVKDQRLALAPEIPDAIKPSDLEDAEEFEKMGPVGNMVLIVGKEGSRIKVPFATIKRYVC